ncbi:uncharacterized protein LOC114712751 [Neltuma alba]|uniref:uncharacterized protein LOC114712751 n=1 Tax=Neltuma alba TaxID=207710 RepID=UPI0010A4F2FF|nr:uncharacterized protein LOC114712751 [Prosopis alba]
MTKLEQNEKLVIGQHSQRKEAAMTLLSEIYKTQNFTVEAQTREAQLKGQISKLQVEVYSKEKEIKECEIKLLSLQRQKKKSVSDTIGFIEELEAMKKKRSHMVDDQIKARHQLENAKRKEAWLTGKLRKFEVPKSPAETYDPEILTEEEIHYLKRTGEKKKNYVPVGRRGVFGGVVLNMHLHWKRHWTVKMDICTGVATTIIPDLLRKTWEELQYQRKHKSFVQDFKREQEELLAIVKSQDTKPAKCFGLCTNCCSQIAQAKELENLMKERIPKMITEFKEFPKQVARAARVPGMEFHSQEFMPFESRKEQFEELRKKLEYENNCMIGLQGLGGTGKSTMAIEVGKQVEKSKLFDKVIFTNVSTPVDEKRIRDDIAKKLELQLEEEMPMSLAQQIWTRIAHVGKVLIILDDVWEELDLKNMGIQPGFHIKGYCCVLLTTRSLTVCNKMGCQKTIQLDVLPIDDALNLFLSHTTARGNDCPGDLKKLAQDIVNECGGLPIMIVAVAKALKSLSLQEWQSALTALKNPMPSRHGIVDEDKRKIYNSLKLSYDHLKGKEAKILFLLCSIFPKAYEIPLELLSRIAIGLGLFEEGDQYYVARSYANEIENALINSSLLLKVGEVYVRMHDVIREMALEKIENEKIQVIMDSKTKLKENVMYSSWIISSFPNCSDDSKVEVLFIWINANGSLEVPNTVFGGMKSLRVLLLNSKIEFGRTSAQSLPKSIQSLKHIRTLSLTNLELDDISVLMRNLEKLESLELTNCSIIELPYGISKLDKLRFLSLIRCLLKKNNPFEVIARCLHLEELYYVSNKDRIPIVAEVPQITDRPNYQTFHIDGSYFSAFDSSQLDASIKKCFKPARLQTMFSNEVIKSLTARAEILDLREDDKTGWSNLIPDIVSIEDDGAMKDLIKLSLKRWSKMKCLIYTKNLQLKSGVTIFSKLIELQLDGVDVTEICCGQYPDSFLKQLEKLELIGCEKLEGTLFKGKLDLGNLKFIEIKHCSMTCFFHPSTAQSLENLETLKIAVCSKLKYIISDEGSSTAKEVDDKEPNPIRSHDSMFPKLKLLNVDSCDELEFILPTCFCEDLPLLEGVEISQCEKLKYMFGQYSKEGGLHQMQKENALPSLKVMSIEEVPSFVNIYQECYLPEKSVANTSEGSKHKDKSPSSNVSWGPLCCFLPKSETANNDESCISTTQLNHTTSQNKYVGNRAHGIFTPPLYPCYLREVNIGGISNLRLLFSVSVASSMSLLEKLTVWRCDELEHIVMEEVDGHDHMNGPIFFPNLRTIEIDSCDKLESLFPASCCTKLVHLEYVDIQGARELEYVFGKSCGDDKSRQQNQNCEIHLPALKKLSLKRVPNMVSMCPEKYYVEASSLEAVDLGECPQLPINSFIDVSVEGHEGQEQVSRKKVIGVRLCNLKHLSLASLDIVETIYDLERLQIPNPVNSSLKTLNLEDLDGLRNICVGPKNLQLSFQNLFKLIIYGCDQLKFVLPASISRSLPCLRHLEVSNCEQLERFIVDDDDEECCFPNLHRIMVEDCKRLKCLFSISTRGSFPQLSLLFISDTPEMEQVFGGKQGATQELHIKAVFPKLFVIDLRDLPKLHTICPAIDFQTVIFRQVEDCPKLSLTSTDNADFIGGYLKWLEESESKKGNMDDDDLFEQLLNRTREVAEKAIKGDRPAAQQNNGSSNIEEITEGSVEERPKPEEAAEANEVKDSEQTSNKPAPPQETLKSTSQDGFKPDEAPRTNEIMSPHDNKNRILGEGKRITHDALQKTERIIHLRDSQKMKEITEASEESPKSEEATKADEVKDTEQTNKPAPFSAPSQIESPQETLKSTCQEGSKSDEALRTNQIMSPESSKPSPTTLVGPSENEHPHDNMDHIEGEGKRITLDQQELPNTEPDMLLADSQKNTEASVGETSNKVAMSTRSITTTETTSPLDENKVIQAETCMPHVSKQLEDDDLMILLQIMEEGAEMEVHMPYASKITHHEDDSEVTKALADLEASMKLGLNEIASSEESKLFLENALNTLSSHCSDDGLKAIIHSLQQEIQTVLSSFKLEQKQKLMSEQRLQRKRAGMTLLSEIQKTRNSMIETQKKAAELKEQIFKLQTELDSKENEIHECDNKLLSLEKQKKESVSDTIEFIKESEAVKKEMSQLENVDSKWSSCVANLKKTSLLLGVHLNQKL